MLFCGATSFAAFDWVMSLAPMWFSTMFGVYLFAGSVLAAHCVIAVGSYVLQEQGAMRDEVTIEHYHDLGKLMFGFVFFWTYISFSQYLLIWYGNIPEETVWFYRSPTWLVGTVGIGSDLLPLDAALRGADEPACAAQSQARLRLGRLSADHAFHRRLLDDHARSPPS